MSEKRKRLSNVKINLNRTPPKKKKEEESCVCLIQCKERDKSATITKFSEKSRKSVYNAAKIRNDANVVSILDDY
ncbi:Hypothetical predicted protein, partial [Paramuricea clavata]